MNTDLAVVRTRLETLAQELRLTAKQREYADAIIEGATPRGPMARHPKVRRYIDEAIVQQRESDKAAGVEPLPAPNDVLRRMAIRARGAIWDHVRFPELDQQKNDATGEVLLTKMQAGEVLLPGGAVLNLKTALAAGLGSCIKGMSIGKDGIETVEVSDAMAADIALGRYLNLEKVAPPVEDEAIRAGREALAHVLATDPDKARQLEELSIQIDSVRVTMKKGTV